MCIGCHNIPGYQASFPEIYKVPMIAGQGAKYISSALTAYRKGDRKHPTMRSIAITLNDQDIADVAAFYEGLGKSASAPAKTDMKAPADVEKLLAKANCASCHGADYNSPIDPTYPKLAVASEICTPHEGLPGRKNPQSAATTRSCPRRVSTTMQN